MSDGQDATVFLDGTPESLVPLWRWILSRLTSVDDPGATDPASVPRERWPSWERYTTEKEPTLSLESLTLLDGLVSYVAAVVRKRAPLARWEIARDRHKRYQFNNHPVLVSGTGEIHNFLPDRLWVSAGAALRGVRESPEDTMAVYARQLIEQLNEGDGGTAGTMEPEPPFEIEEVRQEPGGYDFEIGLGDEIAHERTSDVDRPTSTGWSAGYPVRMASSRSSGRTGKSSWCGRRRGAPASWSRGWRRASGPDGSPP